MTALALATNRWIVSVATPEDEAVRLICFHHAGGAASFFRGWRGALPPRVSLWALQLPGREERHGESLERSMQVVLECAEAELAPLTSRPYILFGHSLGACMAFELAQRMRASGRPAPTLVAISATPAPRSRRIKQTYNLPDREFISSIRAYSGTPDEVLADPDLLNWFLPRLRADTALLETHVLTKGEPLSAPLAFFYGTEDRLCDAGEADRWRHETTGRYTSKGFRGGHFYLREHYKSVIETMTSTMDYGR
jgi:surfactin synthase thioesterase subunit